MKDETKEALALELVRIKVAKHDGIESISAPLLIALYLQSLDEIKTAIKEAKKGLDINPNIFD